LTKTLVELAETQITELFHNPGSSFSPDDQASKVLGYLKDTGRYEAVASGGGRVGIVTVRDLLDVDQPDRTRVESIWEQVGAVDPGFTVLDVAEVLIENGVRALPVVDRGEVKGIISQSDLLDALTGVGELKDVAAKGIMRSPVTTLTPEDGVAQARSLMLDNGISHIPVTKDGKLKGVITAKDIVNVFIASAGKTTRGDRGGEKGSKFPGQVSGVMDTQPLTVGGEGNALHVAREMTRLDKSACVMVDDEGEVLGIITPRELLQLLYALKAEAVLPVYIVGITEEDFFERAVAEEKVRRVVVKSIRMQPRITEVRITVKKQRTQGERTRYSLNARVMGPEVSFNAENEGWGLMEAFDGLMAALDKVLTRAKKEPEKKPRHGRRRPTRDTNP
jgi:CBS domain-containing protein/ribosome-associated translation inhibitor RaiA